MAPSASTSSVPGTAGCLGRGIYDINEVARLLRTGRTRVEGWTRPSGGSPPLLVPELAGLFSFWDLLSLRVVAELIQRGVPRKDIARGAEHLAVTLGTDRPFAHRGLATVGAGFFADVAGDWQDAGKRGQLAFQGVIEPLLEPITFNDSHMASIWRPHAGVWINPGVQAGAPCVDGTRVPTHLLASLLDIDEPDEDDLEAACDDYRLTADQVRAALGYELALAA
ncbi:MAG: DUF433 domain-containing protein [Acidimicrobiaceae bacterium]|nr:DUF433 domain-containing protein [Acidimicrobiaceae bacterium]MYK73352.1 DUF433 domain-containing protein [Acidimicrobiaceae bacterium]